MSDKKNHDKSRTVLFGVFDNKNTTNDQTALIHIHHIVQKHKNACALCTSISTEAQIQVPEDVYIGL